MGEIAIAIRFILHCAGMASGSGVGQKRREIPHASVLLMKIGRVIVAQAVVERYFARDLPRILRVEAPLLLSDASMRAGLDVAAVHQAEQEAGIGESDGVAADLRKRI